MSETSLFRAEVKSVDDTGDIQTVTALGHAGEEIPDALHLQPHGHSFNPPVGSHGIGLRMRGESDLAVILHLQDPGSRPKNLKPGESAFYNGKSVLLQSDGDDLNHKQDGIYTLTAKSFVFKTTGGTTMTLDDGVKITTGGKVTCNDHDIGDTHQHTDTQPGGGLSGKPQ